eukprot:13111713-Ditylum_brightwellii.AAC.2
MFGNLVKRDTPIATDNHHPNNSEVLNRADHQKYQMLLGMLNWIVILSRLDIAYVVSLLACFAVCPRKGHNTRALYTFGYLKKKPSRRIRIDHRDPVVVKNEAEGKLEPFFDELVITAYVDSDYAYNKLTRRSITGLVIFVGRTPVLYQSKRQGTVETSAYGAEFLAMKTTVEEFMAVSVILNSTIPSSFLKKKHVAILYHMTREATATKFVHLLKKNDDWNFAYVLTKAKMRKTFAFLVSEMMC